jgi:AcrR family transcriptional regulator
VGPQGREERTRDRLIQATIEVIAERGWGGVSTRVVAERAGINPGVVHYHFDSIDDLRRRAVLHALADLFDAALATSRDLTPRQIVEATVRATTELGPNRTLLLFEAMPPTARDPLMQRDLADLLRRFRGALAERIRTCHPRPLAEPEVLAAVIAATLDGLLLHLIADPELDVGAHLEPLLVLLGPESPTSNTSPTHGRSAR